MKKKWVLNKVLIYMANHYKNAGITEIHSRHIQSDLNLNYKNTSLAGSYWESQQALKCLPLRGGESLYKITPIGLNIATKLQKNRKRMGIGLVLGLVLGVCFLIYVYFI